MDLPGTLTSERRGGTNGRRLPLRGVLPGQLDNRWAVEMTHRGSLSIRVKHMHGNYPAVWESAETFTLYTIGVEEGKGSFCRPFQSGEEDANSYEVLSLMHAGHMRPRGMLCDQDGCGSQAGFAEMAGEHRRSQVDH